jgi:hypothetical protein
MIRLFLTLIIFLTLTSLMVYGQTVDIDDWKVDKLKIHTITETSIFAPDSIKPDTFPTYKSFYDTTGKIIEKRYDYRRGSLTSKEFNYTSTIYKYDKNGKLIDTKVINPYTPILSGIYISALSECKYFDTFGNLLKIETTLQSEAKETTVFTYQDVTIKDSNPSWTIKLPIQIDYFYNGQLDRKNIIDYSFY